MTEFEPALLDDADALLAADRGGLLRALAGAGAQVRRALNTADEFGIERLRSDVAPRAVLVAPDPNAPYLSALLAALASGGAPIMDWRDPVLPKWAGPADALIVVSADGRHPRLAELVAQADRRGLVLAVAAPVGSPVGAAAARHPVADVSYLSAVPPRAAWWALATPALQALDALGLADTLDLLARVADALDEVAESDRPDSSAFVGRAKLLAAELAESVPVFAGIGHGGTVAAQRIAGSVQLIGGSTAIAAALPDDVARIGSLLEFAAVEADFFADRVSDAPSASPRLVLVGDDDPYTGRPGSYPADPDDARSMFERPELSELDRPIEDRPIEDRPFEDRPFEDRPFEDRSFGDRSFGDRSFGDRSFEVPDPFGPGSYGGDPGSSLDSLGEAAGRRAGSSLAGLATSRGIGVSRVLVPQAPPLVRFAAATATGDFAATYLALARGVDPSAPRLGELPH